ncbi:MAG: class I SAM-dependent methyltransferase [Gammaproteobacteria bacterium]|nr:class I SAM-dependent methyltransferase [Gammaproteobacteria bacterium]
MSKRSIQDKSRKKGKKKGPSMAERADRHILYEKSVQCVEAEIDFVDDTFTELRDRKAKTLREDFCGTANTSCEWVRRRRTNHAIGVDLDADVLAWGREHNAAKLGSAASRLTLINEDVLEVHTDPVDVVLAMNFSYWIFKHRPLMRFYFRRVRDALVDDGVLFLDAFGGSEAYIEVEEETKYDGFTYIWDQAEFNPVNAETLCHIHFKFPDGSRMRNAFSYSWRLWTLPELRELLDEAGFTRSTVYWQGEDEDGEDDGDFQPTEKGEADLAWIAYIVAEK